MDSLAVRANCLLNSVLSYFSWGNSLCESFDFISVKYAGCGYFHWLAKLIDSIADYGVAIGKQFMVVVHDSAWDMSGERVVGQTSVERVHQSSRVCEWELTCKKMAVQIRVYVSRMQCVERMSMNE